MPLLEGTVTISSAFGDTTTTVVPGPIQILSVGAQGPTGPAGPPGPPAAALTAVAGVDLLTVGTVVVLTTDGTLIIADPTNIDHANLLLGMNISTGHMGDNINYLTVGEVTGLSDLSTGELYFVGLDGSLTAQSDLPVDGALWLRALGNAQSSTSFILDKQTPILNPN
jgi:hypothetical protein